MNKPKKKTTRAAKAKHIPSPRLNTIRMIEKAFEDSETGLLTVAGLKRSLPKQVNHNTLIEILDYLDKSNKICIGIKGMLWIHNPSKKWKEAIRKAHDYDEMIAKNSR